MAVVGFDHTAANWTLLQLALYIEQPDAFPVGSTVLEALANTTATLVSDGTADNVITMSDANLTTLINASKPAGYNNATKMLPANAPIYQYTNPQWAGKIQSAKRTRQQRRAALGDPMDTTLGAS